MPEANVKAKDVASKPEEPAKNKRLRSPAYPYINLKAALDRAKEFYAKEKRNPANVAIAVRHWDYRPKSSGGTQTVATLKSFGLIKDVGTGDTRSIQLTDEALRILLDSREESPERDELIKRAALLPKIHRILWSRYGNDLPSDDTLKHELLFTYKFNENALDDFVKEYKATISLAKLKSNDIVSPGQEDSEDEPEGDDMEMQTHEFTQPPPRSGTTTTGGKQGSQPSNVRPLGNAIPVSKNCVMNVMAAGQVTQKGIEQLVAYLNLIKGSFPANEDEG